MINCDDWLPQTRLICCFIKLFPLIQNKDLGKFRMKKNTLLCFLTVATFWTLILSASVHSSCSLSTSLPSSPPLMVLSPPFIIVDSAIGSAVSSELSILPFSNASSSWNQWNICYWLFFNILIIVYIYPRKQGISTT